MLPVRAGSATWVTEFLVAKTANHGQWFKNATFFTCPGSIRMIAPPGIVVSYGKQLDLPLPGT